MLTPFFGPSNESKKITTENIFRSTGWLLDLFLRKSTLHTAKGDYRMKKLVLTVAILTLLLALPMTALANNGRVSMDNLIARGWTCIPIEGEPHCFDPGDAKSNNGSTMNVMVFDASGKFLGTEILWAPHIYNGQPCPQDQILNLGFAYACHHYSH
jgi:hypothetical protein